MPSSRPHLRPLTAVAVPSRVPPAHLLVWFGLIACGLTACVLALTATGCAGVGAQQPPTAVAGTSTSASTSSTSTSASSTAASPTPTSTKPVASERTATGSISFRFGGPQTEPKRPGAGVRDNGAAVAAPFSLTASDGTGLRLVALEARAVLEPPLAFTELFLTFDNPRPETIEGRFQITLPPGAAISRFAMKIGGTWQEGEVVERQRARQIYEDFLHRRQDPALLEQAAGNEFSARVFPIPARGRKELVVSYSHQLERASDPYVLPLRGLPEVERLDLRVLGDERVATDGGARSNLGGSASERRVLTLRKERWTPDADFVVDLAAATGRLGLRHDNLVVARVRPEVPSRAEEIDGLAVLLDTSASRTLGHAASVDQLIALFDGLAGGVNARNPLLVATFDQGFDVAYEGPAERFGTAAAESLRRRRPLGASDLGGALRELTARLDGGRRITRLLLVSDGVATAGETDPAALRAAVAGLATAGIRRLDVLAPDGIRDAALLRQLVVGNLELDGQVIGAATSLDEIAWRLTHAVRSGLDVAVEGAVWTWPARLDGVQPGDEVLIWADLPAGRPLAIRLGDQRVDLDGRELLAAERPLLERAWVQARIERLEALQAGALAVDPDLRRAAASEVTRLSVAHRVLSRSTAFLVLETAADYDRYQLDRKSLADILTVGAAGLEVVNRAASTVPPPVTADAFSPSQQPQRKAPAVSANGADGARGEESPEGAEDVVVVSAESPLVDSTLDDEASRQFAEEAQELVAGREAERDVEDRVAGGVPGEIASGAAQAMPRPQPAPTAPPTDSANEPALRVADQQESVARRELEEAKVVAVPGLTGRYAEVHGFLVLGRIAEAWAVAANWQREAPTDSLALVALGRAAAANGDHALAARAFGSLIDLFPARADIRRAAGEWLETLDQATAHRLAVDTYRKAVDDRPDHLSGHRLLAWALWRIGDHAAAFAALERGLAHPVPADRYRGVTRVLREDLTLLGAAWAAAEPERRDAIRRRLEVHHLELDNAPSLRFVLSWETDANDVDLHVHDRKGRHAYYSSPRLDPNGELFADVTTGYGPECFVIRGAANTRTGPYRLQAHYYQRGPMGYGMGTLQVIEHDGRGGIHFEARPFVVMTDGSYLELGEVATRTK